MRKADSGQQRGRFRQNRQNKGPLESTTRDIWIVSGASDPSVDADRRVESALFLPPPPSCYTAAAMPSTSAHNRVFNEVPNPGPGLPILLWGVIRRLCRFSYRDIAIFEWGPKVTKKTLVADLIACATVAVVLIPQGESETGRLVRTRGCQMPAVALDSLLPAPSVSFLPPQVWHTACWLAWTPSTV